MQVAEIELYEILKSKLGEKEARTLVEYIETKVEKKLEQKKDVLVTKEDLSHAQADLELKIERVKSDLELKIEQVKSDLGLKIEQVKSDLKLKIEQIKSDLELKIGQLDTKIERVKAEIIKWMFLFWIGQVASLIAILQIFFRK